MNEWNIHFHRNKPHIQHGFVEHKCLKAPFSKYARQVTMLVRADTLTKSMSHYLIEQIAARPNIEVRTATTAVSCSS